MHSRFQAIRDEILELEELEHTRREWQKYCENCGKKIADATQIWVRRSYRDGDPDEESFCAECVTVNRDRRPPSRKRA